LYLHDVISCRRLRLEPPATGSRYRNLGLANRNCKSYPRQNCSIGALRACRFEFLVRHAAIWAQPTQRIDFTGCFGPTGGCESGLKAAGTRYYWCVPLLRRTRCARKALSSLSATRFLLRIAVNTATASPIATGMAATAAAPAPSTASASSTTSASAASAATGKP